MTRWSVASCTVQGWTCSRWSRRIPPIRCSGSIRSWSRRIPRAVSSTWWLTSRATPSPTCSPCCAVHPLPPDDVVVSLKGEELMATLQSRSVRRREDVRLLTGKGNYSADAQPPGMLHAALVRSHHAHAAVGSIDTSAARAMPGVVAVFTGADLTDVKPIPGGIGFPRPDGGPAPKTDRPLLASDRVRFVGEPVALVMAETSRRRQGCRGGGHGGVPRTAAGGRSDRRDGARRAAGVGRRARQYRLPVEARRCRGDRRSAARPRRMSRGCSSPSRASPPTRWSRAAPGRKSAATAGWRCTPRTSRRTTCATAWRTAISISSRRKFACCAGDVGGSFGMKSGVQAEYALVAWAARKLRRPVRWISERTEGFLTDEQAREMRITVGTGAGCGRANSPR